MEENEIIPFLYKVAETQSDQIKKDRLVIISLVIIIGMLCGVLGFAIYQMYNYSDFPTPETNISNQNTNTQN